MIFQEPLLLQVVRSCQGIPRSKGSCCRGKGASAPHFRHLGALPTPPAIGGRLAVWFPCNACKMSVRLLQQRVLPGTTLCWLLCCSSLLSPAAGYVIVSSVSWAVTNQVDEELDSRSTEEAMPALLEDSGSIWQRSFPTSVHTESPHLPHPSSTTHARPPPMRPRMFSYPPESSSRLRPGTARFLAHASTWGCLATLSTQEKVSHPAGSRQQVNAFGR